MAKFVELRQFSSEIKHKRGFVVIILFWYTIRGKSRKLR